jgi:hypothetical protein
MGDFDSLDLQGIAQGMRHRLRIAKIAHDNTSFIDERKKSVPALPTRSPMARVCEEKSIRSPSPKGAGGGCIYPYLKFGAAPRVVSIGFLP